MPKCKVDPALKDRVHRFIRDQGLTVNGAAINLGINRTTFWRFCDTGKASPRTKLRLHDALEKRNDSVDKNVSDRSDLAVARAPDLPEVLADLELKRIRKACEGVLALIDVYEAQRAREKS